MWKRITLAVLCMGYVYAESHGDNSISYDMDTFAKEVPKKPHFVMFFAPWCGHCKRLAPTWDELGQKYNTGEDAEVQIAKVDCTQHTELCSKHDVTGYPTLKIFIKGAESSARYRGPRDLANLERFIAEQLGKDVPLQESEAPSAPEPSGGLVEYTDAKYEKLTATGKHFIKFYAPWCGHCQRLAPTWENLAKTFEYHPGLTIGKLDCTQYRDICSRNEVKGYPTLLWIEDGKKVEKYSGDRSIGDLKTFVARMLGASATDGASEDRVEPEASPVVVLTGENFENAIEKGVTFVKFFAPWCGHCKRMAPTYDELGRKFVGHDYVKIAKVDCTQNTSRDLCSQQGVNGFPTVFIYRNGKRLSEYDGSRTLEDMFNFVTSNLSHDEL